MPQNNFPEWIIVHHTGGTDRYPLADTSHHGFDIIQSWRLSKGWDNIGYHYVIEKDGKLKKGRPEHRNGAHARGYNTKSIGIVLSGNFDATMPTEAQIKTLTRLLDKLVPKYQIDLSHIIPHRRVANKTCFGNKLFDTWARDLVKNKKVCKKLSDYSLMELVNALIAMLPKK